MWQILGKLLIFVGISAVGFRYAGELKQRAACLRDWIGAVERLERELGFALLPVELLLRQMKEGSRAAAQQFFARCEERFLTRGEKHLEEIWTETLSENLMPLLEEDKRLLEEIGGILGRYDGDSQRQAFARIQDRLRIRQEEAAEAAVRMGKVSAAVGLCLGLIAAILL